MFGIHLEFVEDDEVAVDIKLAPETDAADCFQCMGMGSVNKEGLPGSGIECPECCGTGKQ